jgi:hypothetical protein
VSVENRYDLTVNIKGKKLGSVPMVTANDSVVFDLTVYDDASPFILDPTYIYLLVSKRHKENSVIREGELVGNKVRVKLGASEIGKAGMVDATLQILDSDNQRVSSASFKYSVESDPSTSGSLPADDKTLVLANESLLTESIEKSNQAFETASTADVTATEAKNTAESVQEQFNQVVIDGDSSPQVSQALAGTPYSTLKEKHEADAALLAQTMTNITDRGINVKQPPFNAKTDGETDETDLFIQIIQYAQSIGLNKIIIPVSANMVIGDVEIPNGFIVEGGGSLRKAPNAKGILKLIGDDIVIQGVGLYSLNYLTKEGFLVDITGRNNRVMQCKINKKPTSKEHKGIRLSALSKNTTIFNNDIRNCAYMVFGQDGAENFSIFENYFNGGSTKGVLASGGSGFTTEPTGDAIKLSRGAGGSYVRVIGNTFENIYRDCIDAFSCGTHVDFSHNTCRNVDVLITDLKTIYRSESDPEGTSDPNNPTGDFIVSFNSIENVGMGQYDSRVFNVGHSTHITTGETYTDVKYSVQRIKIFGNKVNSGSRYGAYINKCKNVEVAHNEFKRIIERNVYILDDCEDIDVFNNDIYIESNINGIHGIVNNSSNSKRIRLKNNKIHGPSHGGSSYLINGIWLQGLECEIDGNSIYNTRTGINVYGIESSTINNNKVFNCSTSGIRLGEIGSTGSVKKVMLKQNYVKDCPSGIRFGNAPEKVIFTDNVANNCVTPWMSVSSLVNSVERNNDAITS